MTATLLKRIVLALAVVFAAMQLFRPDRTNPPVDAAQSVQATATVPPEVDAVIRRACFDCHSSETRWPWYASVAPVSWLVQRDVDEGREHLDVSQWGQGKQHGDETADMVRKGEMPPWFYLPLHPEARLTEAEKQELIRGLVDTFGDKKEGADD